MRRARREHEHIVARDPALLFEQISEGKIELLVAVFTRDPIGLHVMRTGGERDAFFHSGRIRFRIWFWAPTTSEVLLLEGAQVFPIRIDHLDPELIAALREVKDFVFQSERYVFEGAAHGFRGGPLRHRSVITAMPGSVLIRVTGAASVGFSVAAGTMFSRQSLGKLLSGVDFIVRPR